MKKTKIIIPALGMLLLSTAASVTGTVAWFSMNNFVTATGMNIKAKAENGIVISNEAKTEWKESISASHTTPIAVRPTSTATGATWAHSTSNDAAQAVTGNPYSLLAPVLNTGTGAGYVDDNGTEGYQNTGENQDSNYYLLNSFYIKSSAEKVTKPIKVTNVEASAGESPTSANLDKALRVLIVSGDNSLIYAPFDGATLSYNVYTQANAEKTAVTAINPNAAASQTDAYPGKDKTLISSAVIPAFNPAQEDTVKNPIQIDVYLYFEGEDANCKSANLVATLDQISVTVRFGTADDYNHTV